MIDRSRKVTVRFTPAEFEKYSPLLRRPIGFRFTWSEVIREAMEMLITTMPPKSPITVSDAEIVKGMPLFDGSKEKKKRKTKSKSIAKPRKKKAG